MSCAPERGFGVSATVSENATCHAANAPSNDNGLSETVSASGLLVNGSASGLSVNESASGLLVNEI